MSYLHWRNCSVRQPIASLRNTMTEIRLLTLYAVARNLQICSLNLNSLTWGHAAKFLAVLCCCDDAETCLGFPYCFETLETRVYELHLHFCCRSCSPGTRSTCCRGCSPCRCWTSGWRSPWGASWWAPRRANPRARRIETKSAGFVAFSPTYLATFWSAPLVTLLLNMAFFRPYCSLHFTFTSVNSVSGHFLGAKCTLW